MLEIVKVCKKHGELTIDQVHEEKTAIGFIHKCKQCKKERTKIYREKNIEKIREYDRKRGKERRNNEYYKAVSRKASREWRRENADIVNERVRKDRIANPEKYLEYERKNREKNRSRLQELNIVRNYNISYELYKWMEKKQNELCEICGNPETKKSRTEGQICRLTIDHDHNTGLIRDLLCHNCNVLIGHSNESEEILNKANLYLKKHKKRQEIYNELLEKQNKKCFICKQEKPLTLDNSDKSEDHSLLCHDCKRLILWSEGDIEKLERGYEFLQKFEPTGLRTSSGFHVWEEKHQEAKPDE